MALHSAKPAEPRRMAAADARAPEQVAIPCAFMRGGSSRGGFFLSDDLPEGINGRDATLLAAYGSPDERQIDGIGGADPLTSKAAVVSLSDRPDADVNYTFCQVGIDRAQVTTGGNCGNMLAAVGPFAILRGLVPPVEPETVVRIFTTNTSQVVTARISVRDGLPLCEGDCAIAGVPDLGARIALDFGNCAGALSGKLLPTGRAIDEIDVGDRTARVSLVDAATPFVFVDAADIGASGRELPAEILADRPLQERLETVRGWAAVQLGLVERVDLAVDRSPNVPRVVMVSPPADYATTTGEAVAAADCDLVVRQLAMQKPHRALAVTGAVCTAVASVLPGSVVHACTRAEGTEERRIGHPAGVLRVSARMRETADGPQIESVEIERTARLLMDGVVYVRRRKLLDLEVPA